MSDARKTLESSVITGIMNAYPDNGGLTIDKCNTLVPSIVDALFEPCVRWSVAAYLAELGSPKEGN